MQHRPLKIYVAGELIYNSLYSSVEFIFIRRELRFGPPAMTLFGADGINSFRSSILIYMCFSLKAG